jgi:hypothetical protein
MLVCTAPEFVEWRPDFSSSGQASPRWTRVMCEGEQLTNAIDAVDWLDGEPAVQVQLCESCGFAGCESGGYVHVSRLEGHVLWTPPHIDPNDPFESDQYRASEPVRRHGGVAIPVEHWERWRRQFAGLPSGDEFPRTLRRDLLAAWRGAAPIFGQFDPPEQLVQLARERAVAADQAQLDDALAELAVVAEWLDADPDAAIEGALVSTSTEDVAVEALYFDVPDSLDGAALREWRATARVGGGVAPVFGDELTLSPPPV